MYGMDLKSLQRNQILLLILCLVISSFTAYVARTDCPDMTYRCPTGESFTVPTCWSWRGLNCQTCRCIVKEIREQCQQFSCRGSINNWYERKDGCSAGFMSGAATTVFRAACAVHDICYATPGRSQIECDRDFKYNMLKTCEFPGAGSMAYIACAATAGIAYIGVRSHGSIFPEFAETCKRV